MDYSIEIPKQLLDILDYPSLSKLLHDVIHNVQCVRQILSQEIENVTISLDQLKVDESIVSSNRDVTLTREKISIVDATLSSLHVISKYLEEASNLVKLWFKCPNFRLEVDGDLKLGEDWMPFDTFIKTIASFIQRSLENCTTQLNSLDCGYASPYDFSSIIDETLKRLDNKSNVDSISQVESLLKLVQSELLVASKSEKMNQGQQTLITIYRDKLGALNIELSSVVKETENKPKQKSKKLRDIVNGIRLIVKDCYGLIKALESVDCIGESDIFRTINEKGAEALNDVIDYMENIKKEWIEKETVNETGKVCRLAALRRFNIHIKQTKKLSTIKSQLEANWIILGIKNITTSYNKVQRSSARIAYSAYDMTRRCLPKPTVDVPHGFIRDDIIYDELNSHSQHGLLIVLVHIIKYLFELDSSTWNKYQIRKPRKVLEDFKRFIEIMEDSVPSYLDENELQSISFDLADRLCLAKIKIAADRDALEYRLFRYKPKKPFKFIELQKLLKRDYSNTFYGKQVRVRDYIEEHFDEMIARFNRKVTNRGQMVISSRGLEMMKRSYRTLYLMRGESDLLINQATNEFMYSIETLDKLLTNFRPNRRIPFSFNADGLFTQQIKISGLGVKKDFEDKVAYQIEKLKQTIKEKEEDLEPCKEEKTQLRYLISILNRSKLIPINELELTEKDEVLILEEIIEEYEYTLIVYGPVD